MFQNNRDLPQSPFKKLGFSAKIWRCLERAEKTDLILTTSDFDEIATILDEARTRLDIADTDSIRSIWLHNPATLQVARSLGGAGEAHGLLATLPLNAGGYEALISGTFSGKSPQTEWICAPGEAPEAVYVWLVYMPMSFGRLLGAIGTAFDAILHDPRPMFSHAITAHSERLHHEAGFLPARSFFPACQADLQVVFPEQALLKPRQPDMRVNIARSVEDIFKVFSVRSSTYIAEQFCLYEEEFDGNDFCSTQFLGTMDGDAAGCLRLRFFNGFAKLERLAVRKEYRTSRLAYRLVREALEHCRLKGYTRVYGHSRLDLVRFWRVFGFKPIENRPLFAFANVQYAEILAELEPHPRAMALGMDPMMMIRPEGAWDRPGPFDLSLSERDPRRKALLAESVRTIRKQAITA